MLFYSTLTAAEVVSDDVTPAVPSLATPRKLRDYQIEAADAVTAAFSAGVSGPAVVLPTGSGKSTVIAELVRRETACGNRVLLTAHRNELIDQLASAVTAVNPCGPVPSRIGGVHRGDPEAQVVAATVQSLQRDQPLDALGSRDLVIVDECHHAVAATYRKVFEHFSEARRAGFTATMTRLAPAKGEPPLRAVWGEVVYERDLQWAIENGFLLAPTGVTVDLPDLDVGSLHTGEGEITDAEAEAAMMRKATLTATVEAVVTHTAGLSTIVFGSSKAHCGAVASALAGCDVSAELVVGETSDRVREGIYRRFRSGRTRVLVTVDVLTEGADFPRCEAVVLARPTRSQSRLVQCVGRALRPHTFECGRVKERALVVDLVGAGTLGLIVETKLDRTHVEREPTVTCQCTQPCYGWSAAGCEDTCTGRGCNCICDCHRGGESDDDSDVESLPCTCSCTGLTYGRCRCGCQCDIHRVDPLVTFDPVTGLRCVSQRRRRGDSPWSQRTATIRWAVHARGMARPVYRRDGHRGVLMLADMRGLNGTVAGRDWGFGFYDTDAGLMHWINTSGRWQQPGDTCYLQGYSLADSDVLANRLFPNHLKDQPRRPATEAQIGLAWSLQITDPDQLDQRDLSDMIALAHADVYLPNFAKPIPPAPKRNGYR